MARKRAFVIAFSVPYPGDFYMRGGWWRAVREVTAASAEDAVSESRPTKSRPDGCELVVATSWPPAFDVVRAREGSRILS